MSGGHYNYAYFHIETLATDLLASTPLRKAFKKHLFAVAKACHDIEWVDSGDYGIGDEDAAIAKCLGKDVDKLALAEVVVDANNICKELTTLISKIESNEALQKR